MDNEGFLALLEDALRAEKGTIHEQDRLRDLEGWDSIGVLAVIAAIDEQYGQTLDVNMLRACDTVDDLAMLVNRQGTAK